MKSNKGEEPASTQGGFIGLIILIIAALLLMRYFGVTISGVTHWFTSFFGGVLK